MTYFLFAYQLDTAKTLEDLTLSLRSCTINVALMAIGIFLMLKDIDIKNTKIRTLFFEFSKFSFGIYLAHMLILPFINKLLGKIFSTPITILLVSLITLLLTYVVVKVISYLPKSGYLVAT
jgi:surface polysaccharide O-acyltransferase-like enzyme